MIGLLAAHMALGFTLGLGSQARTLLIVSLVVLIEGVGISAVAYPLDITSAGAAAIGLLGATQLSYVIGALAFDAALESEPS